MSDRPSKLDELLLMLLFSFPFGFGRLCFGRLLNKIEDTEVSLVATLWYHTHTSQRYHLFLHGGLRAYTDPIFSSSLLQFPPPPLPPFHDEKKKKTRPQETKQLPIASPFLLLTQGPHRETEPRVSSPLTV